MATLPAAVLSTRGAMKQGRSSFSGHRITILGAGGFMGRYVTSRLGAVGCQMVLPYRGDELYMRHLKPMADLGAISFVKYSIRRLEDVEKVVAGSDVVINLIGLKSETKCARAAKKRRPPRLPRASGTGPKGREGMIATRCSMMTLVI